MDARLIPVPANRLGAKANPNAIGNTACRIECPGIRSRNSINPTEAAASTPDTVSTAISHSGIVTGSPEAAGMGHVGGKCQSLTPGDTKSHQGTICTPHDISSYAACNSF